MSEKIQYYNPIIKGFYPDPSICRVNQDYYLVTSSFEYLPGVPLFHSQNLIDWEQIGHCLTNDSQIDLINTPCSGGIFAPTIRYYHGTFYMITTNITKGNFIVATDDLDKGFGDPIWLDIKGIDPSLYFEGDKVYVQNANFNETGHFIQQCEIDIHTGEILKGPIEISRGCGGRDVEAPHIYHINKFYYLVCAEGGTREGHMVTLQRSQNIYGPFEPCPYNPILSHRDYAQEKLQSVGHADLFEDHEGHWWLVALATRPYKHHHTLGRETILLPVEWNDGWPIVKGGYAKEIVNCEGIEQGIQASNSFYDNFEETSLGYQYHTIRQFIKDNYKVGNHQCILYGNQTTLNTLATPVFIATRQTEYECVFETKLDTNLKIDDQAGLSIFMDYMHHMEIGIMNQEGQLFVYVKKTVADIVAFQKIAYRFSTIILGIEANQQFYNFYYVNNHEKVYIDKTYIKHLSSETSFSPFTGVFCGMFIEGTGQAKFHYFKYQDSL